MSLPASTKDVKSASASATVSTTAAATASATASASTAPKASPIAVAVCPSVCADTTVAMRGVSLDVLYPKCTQYKLYDCKVESTAQKAARFAALIDYLHTALLVDKMFTFAALQEVGREVLELNVPERESDSDKLKELRAAVFCSHARSFRDGAPQDDGCAVIALKSTFDETKSKFEELVLPEGLMVSTEGRYGHTHAAVIHSLRLASDGSPLTVVSMRLFGAKHWGPNGAVDNWQSRNAQFVHIVNALLERKPSGPVIVMGGFDERDPARMEELDVHAARANLVRLPIFHRQQRLVAEKVPVFTCVEGVVLTHIYVTKTFAGQVQAEVDVPNRVVHEGDPPEPKGPPMRESVSHVYYKYCHTVPYGTKELLWPSDAFAVGMYPRFVSLASLGARLWIP